jgi:hypothetical protein
VASLKLAGVTDGPDDYLANSPDAGRMGKAAEYLVAAVCILATRGRLNVSTSIVDDEGVDLVFHLRDSTPTLAVQVKARMTDGMLAGVGDSRHSAVADLPPSRGPRHAVRACRQLEWGYQDRLACAER